MYQIVFWERITNQNISSTNRQDSKSQFVASNQKQSLLNHLQQITILLSSSTTNANELKISKTFSSHLFPYTYQTATRFVEHPENYE